MLATARELLADFRHVEENFKRIARAIVERQAQPRVTKSAIVGHMLDPHDALRSKSRVPVPGDIGGNERRFYSCAAKYCSHQSPDQFPAMRGYK
jgi:hypothetical protein